MKDGALPQQTGSPALDPVTANLLDAGPHITVIVDALGIICGCGVTAEDLFKASQSRLIGRRISELVVGFLFEGNSPANDMQQLLRHCSLGCWQRFEAMDARGLIFSLEVHVMRRITGGQEVFVLNLRRPV